MECKEIQKMIVPFHNKELSTEYEEMFVQHIEQCPDCREELEIHYIIEYGLNEETMADDEDDEAAGLIEQFDFKSLVELKLNDSIKRIDRVRIYNKSMLLVVCVADVFVIISLIWWLLLQLYF